jgi:PKD repeat protein
MSVPAAGQCDCTVTATVPATVPVRTPFQVTISYNWNCPGSDVKILWCQSIGPNPYDYCDGGCPVQTGTTWTDSGYYKDPGQYKWAVTLATATGVPVCRCHAEGNITVTSPPCTVICVSDIPGEGAVGKPVTASVASTASGCSSSSKTATMDWGDQSVPDTILGDGTFPVHIYTTAKEYSWKMTVAVGGTEGKCEETGTIRISENCVSVKSLKICADTILFPTPPSTKYLFEGDVAINGMLFLPGVVAFEGDPESGYGTLSTPGGVKLKSPDGLRSLLPADSQNSFEVDGVSGSLLPNWGTSPRQLGIDFVVPLFLMGDAFVLTPQGVTIQAIMYVGIQGAATLGSVKLTSFFPTNGYGTIEDASVVLGQLTRNITLAEAKLKYEEGPGGKKLTGTFKVKPPKKIWDFGFEGSLSFASNCFYKINGFGITVPLPEPGIPIFSTGLSAKDATFEISGLCLAPFSFFVGGNLKIVGDGAWFPRPWPDKLFTINHVGLKYQHPFRFEVDGGTAMLLGYPQANLKGTLDCQKGKRYFWLRGKLNALEILKGHVDYRLIGPTLRGAGSANLALRIDAISCDAGGWVCRTVRSTIRSVVTLPFTAAEAGYEVKVRFDPWATPPTGYMDFQGMIQVGPLGLAAAAGVDPDAIHIRLGTNYENMCSVWGPRGFRRVPGGGIEQTLQVPPSQERVIFAVVSNGGAPTPYIKNPQGQTITPANVADFPGISYFADTADTVALFRVEGPDPGNWTLGDENLSPAEATLVALAAVPPPTTSFTEVSQNGDLISISVAVTPGSEYTKVGFFFSGAADGSIEGIIAEDLPSTDGTVAATWDSSEAPSGTYYLIAKTEDGKNPAVTTVYPQAITVDHGLVQPPAGLHGTRSLGGDSVTLYWTPSLSPSVVGYLVKGADDLQEVGYPLTFSTDGPNGATLSDLDPAKAYRFCLQALDEEGNSSIESDAVAFPKPGGTPGDCDGSGTVSIGEVQKAINMFLGSLAPGCGVDANADGTVSIGEVQKVINAFLGVVPGISVIVLPSTINVLPNGTQQFTASITGSTNTAVAWSVQEGAPGGTVSASGLYTAPPAAGTYHVVATSQADASKSGTATVTVSGGTCSLTCTASATPGSGQAPLAVNFTATATPTNCSGAVAYAWAFGDGSTSASQNPSHTYASSGTYGWSLTVSVGGQTCSQSGTVTVTAPPCASTCSGSAAISAPLVVQFTGNLLTTTCFGDIVYAWTFGDGQNSTLQNPSHTYASPGTYIWSMTVTVGGAGSCTQNGSVTVTSGTDGTALTSGVPMSGTIVSTTQNGSWNYYYLDLPSGVTGITVDLTGLSGDVDLYVRGGQKPDQTHYDCRSWEDATKNEHCALALAGPQRVWIGVNNYLVGTFHYTVTATAGGGGGCVIDSCFALPVASGLSVFFDGQFHATGCTGTPAFLWQFGDGESSWEHYPTHVYATAGSYTWTFSAGIQTQTCSQQGTIQVSGQ